MKSGVPTVVHWNLRHLCSARTQIRSLAQLSGIKDPALPQLWLGSDLWPENSIAVGGQKRGEKKKKKKEVRLTI